MNDSLTQSEDWYDLRAIESITQIPYSTLRPYASLDILQQALGAQERPGARGVRWPASSLPTWLSLAESIRKKTVQPGTVKNFLREHGYSTETVIAPLPQSLNDSMTQQIVDAIREGVRQSLPPPDDELLTLKSAHARYGVPLSILRGLRVQVGRRYFVKRSVVLRFLASL